MGCKQSKVLNNGDDQYVDYKDVVEYPPGYPAPFAPTSSKKDVFNADKLKRAAERVATVPQSALADYTSLLKHLIADSKSDVERAWSIYLWVVSHNFDDPQHGKVSPGDTPKGYLRLIHDGKGDTASFFAILCRRANIKCAIIDGISKGGEYEVGLPEQEVIKMRDRWNAIYLDKNWRFAHPYWGSKGSTQIKQYFFLTEPEEFNTWCRPDDRQWQLLTTMVTMSEFLNFPYCTAEFFILNMREILPKTGKVKARNGRVYIEVATTRNISKALVVNYSLIGKKLMKPKLAMNGNVGEMTQRGNITSRLHEIEEEGDDQTNEFTMPTAFPPDLENFVFMCRKDSHILFDVHIPVSGAYIFSIEAGQMNPDLTISNMLVVAELKLYCFDNIHEDDIDMFPVVPEIGWGVTPHCIMRGIRPISHVDGEVFALPDSDTVMRFELDHEFEFDVEMISSNFSEDLNHLVSHYVHNRLLTINVRIPGEGHYGLKIYAKGENDADFINVVNYVLVFNKTSSNIEKFPKRMLRERLEKCIEHGNRLELQGALDDFIVHNVPDRGEVKKAKEKIAFFDDKKALADAIKRRNPTYLQKAIHDAKKSKYAAELSDNIKRAEIYLAKLNKMEGFLHPIAKLENSTLAEIKSYSWPPEVVRNVLTATYVLLGEDYEYLQDWEYIQSLMSKVGKEGLKSRVLTCDTDSVPGNQVNLADIIIDPHKLEEAREASTGTAALYQWIKHICDERRSQDTYANSSKLNGASKTKGAKSPGQDRNLKLKYAASSNAKSSQYDGTKKYVNARPVMNVKRILEETSSGNSRSKGKERGSLKPIRDTNISSQHRIPKLGKDNDNIVGFKIVHEKQLPSWSPESKKSPPFQKSPSSKNVSPSQKSLSSKNASPISKNASPISKNSSPANVNKRPSPASKNPSPPSKNISPASKNESPVQRSTANKYISPTQNNSPVHKSPTKHKRKSPNEKSPVQRFHVIKSPSNQSSQPSAQSDDPPHRSPLHRPPEDDILSPRGLSPVPKNVNHIASNSESDD